MAALLSRRLPHLFGRTTTTALQRIHHSLKWSNAAERNECSAEGNLFMEFADRLALSVKNKQKSEAEARRQLNPNCNRSIGLISYRRGWSGKRRYCSRKCRDALVTEPPNESHQDWNGTSRLAWLFLPAPVKPSFKVTPAVVRSRTR